MKQKAPYQGGLKFAYLKDDYVFTDTIHCRKTIDKKIGGSGEIRTHGGLLTHDGFQDRCIKPLCHASEKKCDFNPY